ISYNPPPK
ncbi:Cytoplasmic protein, partial [Monkeypox virus]